MDRSAIIYFPRTEAGIGLQHTYEVYITDKQKNLTMYDCIKFLTKEYYNKRKLCRFYMVPRLFLTKIINLHNTDGIQDLSRIRFLLSVLKNGKELFMENGLPNIKLVITKLGEYVVFDGHHTLIAYMIAGRTLLSQVPHIIVNNSKSGFVTDEEIHVFFGEHASRLQHTDWRKYVLNWQAPKESQLCLRVQRNMGELFQSLVEHREKMQKSI